MSYECVPHKREIQFATDRKRFEHIRLLNGELKSLDADMNKVLKFDKLKPSSVRTIETACAGAGFFEVN